MNLTRLLRPYFVRQGRRFAEAARHADTVQAAQLHRLLEAAARTDFGRRHGISGRMTYADFSRNILPADYESVRDDVGRMIRGEHDVLWPGITWRFAQSSGTTGGKSKYVPITSESLAENHYRGAKAALCFYLMHHGESRIFDGRTFILGGSYANELHTDNPDVRVGDLSATLIDCVNPLVNCLRIPPKQVALMPDWEQKLPRLVDAGLHADVTNISGVPSWFLTVLKAIVKKAGAGSIHDVWPRLEVFFHGGIAFGPYRDEYRAITDPTKMHYVETYNASEGFFAAQDTDDASNGMLLLVDCGVFYEFVPVGQSTDKAVTVRDLEAGRVYEMIVTSCNGLWRYRIGDTVRVNSVNPVRISVAGRTKSFINAFGEELMVYNADRALEAACNLSGASVADYTVAPVYAHGSSHGRHQWLIEFVRPPANMDEFRQALDDSLRRENSDYDAKRSKNIFLDSPEITVARRHLFDDWLALTGKRGGQRKVPRLNNDRTLIDILLSMN